MANPKQYFVRLTAKAPLLMHRDNLKFSESVKTWQRDPQNKEFSIAGDDRSPAWTWIGCLYGDSQVDPYVVMDSDCIMSTLREAGAKMLTGKGKETFKKQTQYGLVVDGVAFKFMINGQQLSWDDLRPLTTNNNFQDHVQFAMDHGFELFVKRAVIGRAKHVRVRPMFRNWVAEGTITVFDEDVSKLTQDNLQRIFDLAGAMTGLCDWRPGSPKPGSYGTFTTEITLV